MWEGVGCTLVPMVLGKTQCGSVGRTCQLRGWGVEEITVGPRSRLFFGQIGFARFGGAVSKINTCQFSP